MALDIKKLRAMQKDIKKKAGDGGDLYLYANKLPEETDVRILPPKENMNGIYFVEQVKWWVNGKPVVVDGDNDVVEAEIEEARASKDKSLIALLDKKKSGMPLVKKEITYLIPVLELKTEYDDDDEMVSCEVVAHRVLVAKPTLLREINKVVTGRQFQNGTEFGIADREKGYNIILTKEGSGMDTKYGAMGWNTPMEIEAKYYNDKDIPDVVELDKKSRKSEEYQVSVIRNYLYGDPILEDGAAEKGSDDDNDSDDEVKTSAKKSMEKLSTRPASTKKDSVANEEETPKRSKPSRSLIDDAAADMEDM